MKVFITLLFSTLLSALAAQPGSYQQAMGGMLPKIAAANSSAEHQQLGQEFARVAAVETQEWHPRYYAAHQFIVASFELEDDDQRDELLDMAETHITKALEIVPTESELFALQALLYMGRIQVSPMIRGMTYTEKVFTAIDKARQLNPTNPRSYYMEAMMTWNMPGFLGGGKDKACPVIEEALTHYATFEPETPFSPNWGFEAAQGLQRKCAGE